MNFKGFGNDQGTAGGSSGGRPPPAMAGNFSLTRQSSVYSLTVDEFMNSMGGSGKDFGSMNMDELLKNIWTAEEVQTMGGEEGLNNNLQRQGSLTLPRTLSLKTVDEVFKDISKDFGPNLAAPQAQRQPTLGEMTLEEFLVRAGVVREDAAKPNDGAFVDLSSLGNNSGLGLGFQTQQLNINKVTGLMGNNRFSPTDDPLVGFQSPSTNLPLNVNGVRSSNQQPMQSPQNQLQVQHQQQQQNHQQQIFPKQPVLNYATQIQLAGNQGMRGGMVGLAGDHQGLNGNLVQGGGIGMVGLPHGTVQLATGSPASDKIGKSNGDTSSVSPVPYVFNGGMRGRKNGAVEKVIERRQRRMIKNRESAARSRARKQAYTMELEAEVAKLKEENEELQKKQAEIMEIQKNQVKEMMNLQREVKRKCLRRTQTGPW
uniref:BZIP transcription factor n=1 Tax=Oxytropis ochrocephala TaxID=483875 RepID=A0A142CR61_9FABA|nr:bZIP transcription factor [Oxytropis ochrocephala]